MSQKWPYIIEVVAVAMAVATMAGAAMSYDSTLEISSGSTEVAAQQLETARLLYQETVTVPIGPLIVIGTPFHLAYIALSIGLTCFAMLVILADFLFRRRRSPSPGRFARA
jgi:hypothetical protein